MRDGHQTDRLNDGHGFCQKAIINLKHSEEFYKDLKGYLRAKNLREHGSKQTNEQANEPANE